MTNIVRLRYWSVVVRAEPHWAPEQVSEAQPSVSGLAFGHPDFPDGGRITSSPVDVSSLDPATSTLTTFSGTVYQLLPEDIDPFYEDAYPNAYERLFKGEGR